MLEKIRRVPIDTLIRFLESTAAHAHTDLETIGNFAGGFSESTAKRAVPVLESLGLVERSAAGEYACKAEGVRRGMNPEAAKLVLRHRLQGYRPFEALCEGVLLGESEPEAVRRAAILLGVPDTDHYKFEILIEWGIELGVLERRDGTLALVQQVTPPTGGELEVINASDVENEARARLYNASRLGREATNFLDETDRALLGEATLLYQLDPKKSVEKAGQALEDFLREVAEKHGLSAEAKLCNGAGQLGNLLFSNGLIHSNHNQLIQALAVARNATAHRKDKKTLKPWDITPFAAFWVLAGVLAIIRSSHEYIYGGKQTL